MMLRMCRAAFWPSCEMYSPLTTNPRCDGSLPDPVVEHGDSGQHSRARVGEVEGHGLVSPDRAGNGTAHRRLQPLGQAAAKLRDAAADHHIERRGLLLCLVQAVQRRRGGKTVGVLVSNRDATFVDAGQAFQIDVRVVTRGRHQLVCREHSGRQMPPSPGQSGAKRRRGSVTLHHQPMFGHSSPSFCFHRMCRDGTGQQSIWTLMSPAQHEVGVFEATMDGQMPCE